ncbi:unnamed protein product, partial [Effrenium voratum]
APGSVQPFGCRFHLNMMDARMWCLLFLTHLACGSPVQATGCGDECVEADHNNLLQAHVRKTDTPFVAGYCMNTLCGDYQNHGQSMVLLIAGQKDSLANPMVAAVPSWLSQVPYRCLSIGGAGVGGTLLSSEALGGILKQHNLNCVNFDWEGEVSGPQLGAGLALAQAVKGQGYTVVFTTLAGSYVDPTVQSWVNENAASIDCGSMTTGCGNYRFLAANKETWDFGALMLYGGAESGQGWGVTCGTPPTGPTMRYVRNWQGTPLKAKLQIGITPVGDAAGTPTANCVATDLWKEAQDMAGVFFWQTTASVRDASGYDLMDAILKPKS